MKLLFSTLVCASMVLSVTAQELPQPPQHQTRIYSLRFLDAAQAADAIKPLLGLGDSVAAEVRTNSIIMRGTPGSHKEVEALLQRLDSEKPDTQLSIMQVQEAPGKALLETIRLIGDGTTDYTYDDARRILILKGRKDDVKKIQDLIRDLEVIKVAEQKAVQEKQGSGQLRLVWLESGNEKPSDMLTDDLRKALAPLAGVGIRNLGVRGQVLLHIGDQQSQIESTAMVRNGDLLQKLSVRGEVSKGTLQLQIEVDDQTRVGAGVQLKPGHWVILGAVGDAESQMVFAIQQMAE